jgi:hypothetical protein
LINWLALYIHYYFVWTSREGPWPWYRKVYTQSFVFCQHVSWMLGTLPLWISAKYLCATTTFTLVWLFFFLSGGKKLVYTSRTGALLYCLSINIPRLEGNPPLRVWSALREVVPHHRQLPFGNTIQNEMDGSNYFMPLPKRSREVVFTSPTVTKVTTYRVRWMITNQEGH